MKDIDALARSSNKLDKTRTQYLTIGTGFALLGCLLFASSCAGSPPITIDKAPPKIERLSKQPTDNGEDSSGDIRHKPPLSDKQKEDFDSTASTHWFFSCKPGFDYDVLSEGMKEGTEQGMTTVLKIRRIQMHLALPIEIHLPDKASKQLIDHENGHVRICELVYAGADKVAREAAQNILDRNFTGAGTSREKAQQSALEAAGEEISLSYRKHTVERANEISDEYDQLSRVMPGLSIGEAIRQAVQHVDARDKQSVSAEQNESKGTRYIVSPALAQSLQDAPRSVMRLHPYVAHFSKNGMDLFIVAASHEQKPGNETFQVIERVLNQFPIKRAIIEGYINADGDINLERVKDMISRDKARGFYDWGEDEYTIQLSHEKGIPVIGGEPTQKDQAKAAYAAGFKTEDLLGLTVINMIPAYLAQGKIERLGMPTAFKDIMSWARDEIGVPQRLKFDYEDFLSWHKLHVGSDFDPRKVHYNMQASNPSGTFIQRIGVPKDRIRNQCLAKVISNELDKYKSVLVVYGNGHYACLKKAIENGMGRPAYEGDLSKPH